MSLIKIARNKLTSRSNSNESEAYKSPRLKNLPESVRNLLNRPISCTRSIRVPQPPPPPPSLDTRSMRMQIKCKFQSIDHPTTGTRNRSYVK